MTLFFTSDLHFGHANIIKHSGRPFADLAEMHTELVDRWNAVVRTNDDVYILGDFHLGKLDFVLSWAPLLAGRKHLFPGNHDLCFEGDKGRTTKVERARTAFRLAGFGMIYRGVPFIEAGAGGRTCTASHFPYRNDHPDISVVDERYRALWPPEPEGDRWHLHGHVHERWSVWPETRQINVGVDAWGYAPVSEEELAAEIERHS
jgi:calcineurin-like phosphoesterase family protein